MFVKLVSPGRFTLIVGGVLQGVPDCPDAVIFTLSEWPHGTVQQLFVRLRVAHEASAHWAVMPKPMIQICWCRHWPLGKFGALPLASNWQKAGSAPAALVRKETVAHVPAAEHLPLLLGVSELKQICPALHGTPLITPYIVCVVFAG